MNVVAYFRCSTDKQVESGLGLDAQRSQVEAFCARQGLSIVSSYVDEGVSGKTELQSRPELLNAFAELKATGAEALVVAKIDRLSRDVLVQLTLEKMLGEMGVRLLSAAGEGTDDESPQGTLVRNLMAVVAQHEAAMVSVRTKAAMKAAKAKGIHVGRPPMGMERNEWGEWEAGADFWMVACILMLRFRKKMSYRAIAEIMNEKTSVDARNGRTFTKTHVFNTCKRWGRRTDWYKPYKTADCFFAGMENPAWLQDYDTSPRI